MKIEILEINDKLIWLAIDQLRIYSVDQKIINTKNEFLCYFKLTEPTPFIYGELFLDKSGKPILFDSEQSAIEHAKAELDIRIKKNSQ